jgi:hypothetical protein
VKALAVLAMLLVVPLAASTLSSPPNSGPAMVTA